MSAERVLLPRSKDYYTPEPISDWIQKGLATLPRFKLFDDVSFIYEAQLAKMELHSWQFDLEEFRKRAAYFEEINGQKTYHNYISDIRGKGQIGRTNQYLTHWYYPYKAKFHPQMVKALINWMGLTKGDRLLDPFVGSGTALIEAKLVGVDGIGVDIDPFCTFMTKVKTDLLDIDVADLQHIAPKKAYDFFKSINEKPSQTELRRFVETDHGPKSTLLNKDERIHEFFLLSYLYALSDYTYVKRDMWDAFSKNVGEMLRSLEMFGELKRNLKLEMGKVSVKHGDARFLHMVPSETVDGIISSPPYSIAVNYVKNDLHTFKFLGIEPGSLQDSLVGLRGRHDERVRIYFEDMRQALESMFRVLRPQAKCVVVIGDVTFEGQRLPITSRFAEIAERTGFESIKIIRRPILGGFARLRYENIMLFQKP